MSFILDQHEHFGMICVLRVFQHHSLGDEVEEVRLMWSQSGEFSGRLFVGFYFLSPTSFFPHYSQKVGLKINLSDIMCVLVLPSESSQSALVTSTYINSLNSSEDWEHMVSGAVEAVGAD